MPQPSPGTQQFCLNSVFFPLCVPLHCPKSTTARRVLKTRGAKRAFVPLPHFPVRGSELRVKFLLEPKMIHLSKTAILVGPSIYHCPCVPAWAWYQRRVKITLPALKKCCRKHPMCLAKFYSWASYFPPQQSVPPP